MYIERKNHGRPWAAAEVYDHARTNFDAPAGESESGVRAMILPIPSLPHHVLGKIHEKQSALINDYAFPLQCA